MKPACLIFAVLPSVLLVSSCTRSNAAANTPPQQQGQTVEVVRVLSEPFNTTVRLPGELVPYESVALLPKVSGFVDWIGVDRGSKVRKGQLLARLVAPEIGAQRAESEAGEQRAHAQMSAAKAKLASDQSTFEKLREAAKTPGVVAGNDLLSAQKLVEADEEQVKAATAYAESAKHALRATAQNEQYLRIEAPFDGVITERNVHPGALVSASQTIPMLRIETLKHLRVVVPVPEAYASSVPERGRVEFTVASNPSDIFEATVARNSHAIDLKTRTMPVELDFDNATGKLQPGTFSEVHWPVKRDRALFVPATAVASNLERTFVVRVRDNKTEWVDVKQGAANGKLVEVYGELAPGDTVVARGTDELAAGTTVTAKATEEK